MEISTYRDTGGTSLLFIPLGVSLPVLSPSLACMDTFPLFRTPGGLILDQYRSRPRSAAMASTLRPQVLNSPPHFTFISSNAVVSKRYAPFESPHCSFLHLWFQISTAQSTFHCMIRCWSCVEPPEFFSSFFFVCVCFGTPSGANLDFTTSTLVSSYQPI